MLVEHPSHPYDAARLWLFMDASSRYVAGASWHADNPTDTSFNGPSRHKICTKLLSAETDDLDELRAWAEVQLAFGASRVSIHETWPITEGRLAGKRENCWLEAVTQPAQP